MRERAQSFVAKKDMSTRQHFMEKLCPGGPLEKFYRGAHAAV